MMTDLVAGHLTVHRETNNRYPYINSDGRYYSELIGDFVPAVGSAGRPERNIIVKGTFEKYSYKRGLKDGFQVVVQNTNRLQQGQKVFDADDRTHAHQSVQDREMVEVLMLLHGIGEVYSERMVTAFNHGESFFTNLRRYMNGTEPDITCDVPERILKMIAAKEEDILQLIEKRSVDLARFCNVLNKFGLVSYNRQSTLGYQRSVKEWAEMYKRIETILSFEKRSAIPELVDNENLVKELGRHILVLMTRPWLVFDVFGAPLQKSVQSEANNVALAHGLLEVASSELEPSDIQRLGLGDKSFLAYTFDLYEAVKRMKDDGFDNPRNGDTLFAFDEYGLHRTAVRKPAVAYPFTFDEAVEALGKDDTAYPVRVFEVDGQCYAQFAQTYRLNQSIIEKLIVRVPTGKVSFAEPKDYQEAMDDILEDNKDRFQLHPAQYNALLKLNDYTMSILTGGPGTGKTTILSVFLRTLARINQSLFDPNAHRIIFCAPTGKAAKRMKDSLNEYLDEYPMLKHIQSQTYTIHSLLLNKTDVMESAKQAAPGTRWLIIDESSMVDEEMLNWILKDVPDAYRIVFIGDEEQLPSIGPGSVLDDLTQLEGVGRSNLTKPYRSSGTVMQNAYAIRGTKNDKRRRTIADLTFDASFSLIDYKDLIAVHKAELGRDDLYYQYVLKFAPDVFDRSSHSGWAASFLNKQADSSLLDLKTTMVLMPFAQNPKEKPDRVSVNDYNRVVQGLTNPFRHMLPPHLETLPHDKLMKELNRDNELYNTNRTLQQQHGPFSALGTNKNVIFRMGDSVVSTKNQYATLVFNTDIIGTVVGEKKDKFLLTIEDLCKSWYTKLQKFDLLAESTEPVMNGDIGEVKAVLTDGSYFVQFADHPEGHWVYFQKNATFSDSLALSHSNTVHKSQGSEAEVVVMFLAADTDTSIMNYRELLYTGITRAKSKVVLVGSVKALEEAMNTQKNIRHTALPYLFQLAGIRKEVY